ncbi:5'-nucleotidase-like [Epinephelus moara]|uniref:5'-nucleotidase-like n=1 Tax=Epinephelus moara TaxID=300413 RepID=UPI00214F1361|nr:5'-nucleotidase-like [Epinephelus moara]
MMSAFGNHEFDNGVEGLMRPFLEQINFMVLSANIKTDRTLASTFGSSYLPHEILTVGSEKVGVIGYTTQETPVISQPDHTCSSRTR